MVVNKLSINITNVINNITNDINAAKPKNKDDCPIFFLIVIEFIYIIYVCIYNINI